MKIGVFDSGLGGLLIASAIRKNLPEYDLVYLGDTLHMPYGNRSREAVYDYTVRCIRYLFEKECQLIILACNTASALALRQIQQKFLPACDSPDRRILGVVVPTLEAASEHSYKRLGVIATSATVRSGIFSAELHKINPSRDLLQTETPLLAPMIDNDGMDFIDAPLQHYIRPLKEADIDCLLLGCTHYILIKDKIKTITGDGIDILSQDDIIPPKLANYLQRHPEIDKRLDKMGRIEFYVTDRTPQFERAATAFYGSDINLQEASV